MSITRSFNELQYYSYLPEIRSLTVRLIHAVMEQADKDIHFDLCVSTHARNYSSYLCELLPALVQITKDIDYMMGQDYKWTPTREYYNEASKNLLLSLCDYLRNLRKRLDIIEGFYGKGNVIGNSRDALYEIGEDTQSHLVFLIEDIVNIKPEYGYHNMMIDRMSELYRRRPGYYVSPILMQIPDDFIKGPEIKATENFIDLDLDRQIYFDVKDRVDEFCRANPLIYLETTKVDEKFITEHDGWHYLHFPHIVDRLHDETSYFVYKVHETGEDLESEWSKLDINLCVAKETGLASFLVRECIRTGGKM